LILPIGIPFAEPAGVTAVGFRVDAANRAFSSKLKAKAAVGATIDFLKKPLRFTFSDIVYLSLQFSYKTITIIYYFTLLIQSEKDIRVMFICCR